MSKTVTQTAGRLGFLSFSAAIGRAASRSGLDGLRARGY